MSCRVFCSSVCSRISLMKLSRILGSWVLFSTSFGFLPDLSPTNTPVRHCKLKISERMNHCRRGGPCFLLLLSRQTNQPPCSPFWKRLPCLLLCASSFPSASSEKCVEEIMPKRADLPLPWTFSTTFLYQFHFSFSHLYILCPLFTSSQIYFPLGTWNLVFISENILFFSSNYVLGFVIYHIKYNLVYAIFSEILYLWYVFLLLYLQ